MRLAFVRKVEIPDTDDEIGIEPVPADATVKLIAVALPAFPARFSDHAGIEPTPPLVKTVPLAPFVSLAVAFIAD